MLLLHHSSRLLHGKSRGIGSLCGQLVRRHTPLQDLGQTHTHRCWSPDKHGNPARDQALEAELCSHVAAMEHGSTYKVKKQATYPKMGYTLLYGLSFWRMPLRTKDEDAAATASCTSRNPVHYLVPRDPAIPILLEPLFDAPQSSIKHLDLVRHEAALPEQAAKLHEQLSRELVIGLVRLASRSPVSIVPTVLVCLGWASHVPASGRTRSGAPSKTPSRRARRRPVSTL